ncbi:hypothetical protein J1605_013140 [Eschrichtius robustus]|uniref:ATP synthase subunit b n=1 Tax=Eschrichtius robustus TaxID=9764 RepID=A0AB34GH00_ESCRO|nr:hypothetical protein J1605_013140 [Eschrichtius robustus]
MRRLSSCGSQAQLLRGMWDLPRPGLEPVSPALAGRLSTTAPPGKPRHYLFDVQRNNIAMALEVTYWERLHSVYKEVKNHLDYHISVQNMMHQKEQGHMINCVEKNVVQSISAQQEKETIAKSTADLKLLAKKAQAQPVL